MKTYTNSKGESLPKVICAVVEFENKRLDFKPVSNELQKSFTWFESNIFGKIPSKNVDSWKQIDNGNYDHFYSIFPTCKNLRGQELPEEIQVEIVEERLRQWDDTETRYKIGFNWLHAKKGTDYWHGLFYNSDYSETTKSDDTFTQGEIVEVSDDNFSSKDNLEFVCYDKSKGYYVCRNNDDFGYYYSGWKYCRKIQPLELTLPELLTIAESVKRTKVKLKS